MNTNIVDSWSSSALTPAQQNQMTGRQLDTLEQLAGSNYAVKVVSIYGGYVGASVSWSADPKTVDHYAVIDRHGQIDWKS